MPQLYYFFVFDHFFFLLISILTRALRRSAATSGHEAFKKYLRSRGPPPKGLDVLDEETDEFTQPLSLTTDEYDYICREAKTTKTFLLKNKG